MKDKLSVARIKRAGITFEVVIEPEKALAFRQKKIADVNDAIRDDKIFTDAKKGLLASEETVLQTLKVATQKEAIECILREGEIQFTTAMREEMLAQKRQQILNEIHRYGVDPRTGAPHPMTRIENALNESKVRIDEYKPALEQVKDIVKHLITILPLKIVTKRIEVHIPMTYAAQALPRIRTFATIKKEHWQNDGSWLGEVEIPGGLEPDFYDLLKGLTQGKAEATVKSQSE
jgi:ribosome maturation protein SDO1